MNGTRDMRISVRQILKQLRFRRLERRAVSSGGQCHAQAAIKAPRCFSCQRYRAIQAADKTSLISSRR